MKEKRLGVGRVLMRFAAVYLFKIMGLVSGVAAFSFFSIVKGKFFGGFI